MVRVPDFIREMRSLRHLYMCDAILPNGMNANALENLETLIFIPFNNELSGLRIMSKLRKLGIQDLDESSDVSALHESILPGLEDLDSLILRGFRYRNMPEQFKLSSLAKLTQLKVDGLLTRLPDAYAFPKNLSYSTLVNTCLHEDPMPILEELRGLFHLKLRNAYTGRKMAISSLGFYKLEVLKIGELWNLREVRGEQGALEKLERLEICSCPYLETIPEEMIGNNVQELKMVTTRRIAKKIRESGIVSKVRHPAMTGCHFYTLFVMSEYV